MLAELFLDVVDEDVTGLEIALCEIGRTRDSGALGRAGPKDGLERRYELGDLFNKVPEETVRSLGGVCGSGVVDVEDFLSLSTRGEEVTEGALFTVVGRCTGSSTSSQASRMIISRVAH